MLRYKDSYIYSKSVVKTKLQRPPGRLLGRTTFKFPRPPISVGWHAFNYAFYILEWGRSEGSVDVRIMLNRTKDLPGLVQQFSSFSASPLAQILFIQALQLSQGWIKSHQYPLDRSCQGSAGEGAIRSTAGQQAKVKGRRPCIAGQEQG